MFRLKNYQKDAVDELLTNTKRLLEKRWNTKLTFQAPTASGKTIMVAELLKNLVTDPWQKRELSFIWAAPHKLHNQSKAKLENYYQNTRDLKCSSFNDLLNKQVAQNEILFLNWESINKTKNIIIEENERDFYLDKIIENTVDAGREIILIIDESHHTANSDISKKLKDKVIRPKLAIQVSATPKGESDYLCKVAIQDVKEDGMIKKSVHLQKEFDSDLSKNMAEKVLTEGKDTMILGVALEKRNELKAVYKKLGIDINPLLLIQLPNTINKIREQHKEKVIKILKDNHSITPENGKLAIHLYGDKYLSGKPTNLENVEKNNNETEVLIFKQALALGWDCPRAHIIVLFREMTSNDFTIQTIGRIMRMPEPEKGHYDEDILNHAYAYTSLSEVTIDEDYAKDYVTTYTSNRIKIPLKQTNLGLKTYYRERHREKIRLDTQFIKIFLKESEKYDLAKKIKTKNQIVKDEIISHYTLENVDTAAGTNIEGKISFKTENLEDIQALFNWFIYNNMGSIIPDSEGRSVGRIKEAIYYFFDTKLDMHQDKNFLEILNIILSKENSKYFVRVIDLALNEYSEVVQKRQAKLIETDWFMVPEKITYKTDVKRMKANKSIMQPFYHKKLSNPEKAFIKHLENSSGIQWWFRNEDRDATYLAVPYEENGEKKPFYIDFIVRCNNGKIGLFDTKSGMTITQAAPDNGKSDGLQKYIKKYPNLYGGITTNTKRDFSGNWLYFKRQGRDLVEGDFTNWELLEF